MTIGFMRFGMFCVIIRHICLMARIGSDELPVTPGAQRPTVKRFLLSHDLRGSLSPEVENPRQVFGFRLNDGDGEVARVAEQVVRLNGRSICYVIEGILPCSYSA